MKASKQVRVTQKKNRDGKAGGKKEKLKLKAEGSSPSKLCLRMR